MRLLTLLALAGLGAGIYHYRNWHTPRRAAAQEQAVSDERLAESVRSGIAGAASRPIDVRCMKGVVSLRGTVAKATERDLVLAAALAVPGVSQVTNLIDVEEPLGEIGTMQSGIATPPLSPTP